MDSPKKTPSKTKSMLMDSFRRGSLLSRSSNNRKVFHLNINDVKFIDKELFKKQLQCQVCFGLYSKLNRQHHCRVCGNAVCSNCSNSTINKERVCDTCAYRYSEPQLQNVKRMFLDRMTKIILQYIGAKVKSDQQVEEIKNSIPEQNKIKLERDIAEQKINELKQKIKKTKENRQFVEEKIKQIQGE